MGAVNEIGPATRSTSADASAMRSTGPSEDFATWLGSPVLRVSLRHQHGQWYATAEDFSIAGAGKNQMDAVRDVLALVEAYLHAHHADGRTYAEAIRPLPGPCGLSSIVRRVRRELSRLAPQRERDVVLPSALHVGPTA